MKTRVRKHKRKGRTVCSHRRRIKGKQRRVKKRSIFSVKEVPEEERESLLSMDMPVEPDPKPNPVTGDFEPSDSFLFDNVMKRKGRRVRKRMGDDDFFPEAMTEKEHLSRSIDSFFEMNPMATEEEYNEAVKEIKKSYHED